MATITPAKTSKNVYGSGDDTVIWTGMATGDTITALDLSDRAGLSAGAIQITGTFGGATVTAQVSNDGTNWATLKDIFGDAISTTSAALQDFTTGALYMRFAVSGGTGDDIDAVVSFR